MGLQGVKELEIETVMIIPQELCSLRQGAVLTDKKMAEQESPKYYYIVATVKLKYSHQKNNTLPDNNNQEKVMLRKWS